MRGVLRNKRTLWYALYGGKTPKVDSNGHKTGEYEITWSTPVKYRGNYSAGSSDFILGEYGIKEEYDRMLLVFDKNCPIAEGTILWLGIEPTITVEGVTTKNPHNYVVSKKQDGLNNIRYGLKKVKVS